MSDFPDTMLPVTTADLERAGFPSSAPMAPGLAVFFNDALYNRCRSLAQIMARAEGMMPKHLIGKPEACFAIMSRAITWNLDPFATAMSTYQTPGGAIGFEGKLVQAILENSGRLDGNVKFELFGPWENVKGKFKLETGKSGGKYPVPTWTVQDAKGCGVIVSALVKGEKEARSLPFDLDSAFPLNSPLWATAPERQIKYTAVRAFGNQVMPGILMGIPFDTDPTGFYGEPMTNVTPPRPTKATGEFDRGEMAGAPAETKQVTAATSTETAKPSGEPAKAEPKAEPPKDEKKDAPAPVEAKDPPKAETKATPEPDQAKAEPEPAEREPGQDDAPAAETTGTADDDLNAWFKTQMAGVADVATVAELFEMRKLVEDTVGEPHLAEFKKAAATRATAIIKAELAACATVKKVTDLRKGTGDKPGYEGTLTGEMAKWFDAQATERQREILAATRKPAAKK